MKKSENLSSAEKFSKGIFSLDSGRIPPQALDLEEAVLGAMLIDKKGVDEVIDILQKDAFTKNLTRTYLMRYIVYFNPQSL